MYALQVCPVRSRGSRSTLHRPGDSVPTLVPIVTSAQLVIVLYLVSSLREPLRHLFPLYILHLIIHNGTDTRLG
jgi:hypothetical protein